LEKKDISERKVKRKKRKERKKEEDTEILVGLDLSIFSIS